MAHQILKYEQMFSQLLEQKMDHVAVCITHPQSVSLLSDTTCAISACNKDFTKAGHQQI
jgi:hypothetical protein